MIDWNSSKAKGKNFALVYMGQVVRPNKFYLFDKPKKGDHFYYPKNMKALPVDDYKLIEKGEL